MIYPAYYCTALALCRLAHLIRSCRPFKSPNSLCPAKFKISCCLVFKNTCYFQCRRWKRPKWATARRRATQCDYKWLKNAENDDAISRIFSNNVWQNYIISVSGQFTCFHIQNLQNRCKHKYNQSNFTFLFWTLFLAGFCHWAQMWATSSWEGKRRQ